MFKKILILALSSAIYCGCSAQEQPLITSYSKCVEAGNLVLRSMPPQCVTRDGERFIASTAELNPKRSESKKYCEDLCGDGTCQILVCNAVGCPCAESKDTCKKDCSE